MTEVTTTPPRALAPDLARGGMLLLIVLANIPWFLYGSASSPSLPHPVEGTTLDRVVQALMTVLVDGRALPMFALLFGYGMVQFMRAQEARGTPYPQMRVMLQRRHVALIVLGAVHAGLLFFGDVLGGYGLLGLILVAALLGRPTRVLKLVRAVLLGLLVLYALFSLVGGIATAVFPEQSPASFPAMQQVNATESYVASIGGRLLAWLAVTGGALVAFAVPAAILTGWIWAREGLLDRPAEHLPVLRRIAVVGLAVGWLGGIPAMGSHQGWWLDPELTWAFAGVQSLTGLFAGMGYAALFGLVAARLGQRRGPAVVAVSSVGRRSLSAYLFQALVMAPLLAAWGLGLGATLGSAAVAAIAIGIWLVSVALCTLLDRAGRPGPAEVVLRRVTYGARRT